MCDTNMRYKNIKNNTKMKIYATVCKLSKYTVYYTLKNVYKINEQDKNKS